jgi:crotonobetainyl-CoA hydratase
MTNATVTEPAVDTSKVRFERVDHTLVITLNRPDQRNAVDHDVSYLIGKKLEEANADKDVWVIVLTGAGDKAFCAGLDLKALSRGERMLPRGMEHYNLAGFARHFTSKPTIAAVDGLALGGGTELALACDLIVASERASFGLPEVKRGLLAGAGGAFRVTEVFPQKVALELLLTGEPLSAAEAHRWGFVNRLVPAGTALDAALELAALISRNAPLALQATKRLAYRLLDGEPQGEPAMWDANNREAAQLFRTKDGQEGPRAFAEKRAPVWAGE